MVLQVTLKRKAVSSEDTICPKEAKYLAMLENKRQFMKGAGERTRNKHKQLDEERKNRVDDERPFTEVKLMNYDMKNSVTIRPTEVKPTTDTTTVTEVKPTTNTPEATSPKYAVEESSEEGLSQTLSYAIPESLCLLDMLL